MAGLKLPRTSLPEVLLAGPLWNRVCDTLERLDRLQFSQQFNVSDGPAGRLVSLRGVNLKGVIFVINSTASGGGKYHGRTLVGPASADVSDSSNLADADFGTFAGANDVLALNTRESGAGAGHDLDAAGFLPLIFFGWLLKTNSDGVKVVAFDGAQHEDCTEP
jgi:hypothetical protein